MNAAYHEKVGLGFLVQAREFRREYLILDDNLVLLARTFGVTLTPEDREDAAVLALAIENVDRYMDARAGAAPRAKFCAQVLGCIGSGQPGEELAPETAQILQRLRKLLLGRGIVRPFVGMTRAIFRNCEELRNATTTPAFLRGVMIEGRLMTELLLLILRNNSTPAFRQYFRRISGSANLVDKWVDGRADFASGERVLRPDWRFNSAIGTQLLKELVLIVLQSLSHPQLIWGGLEAGWHNFQARRVSLGS